MAAKTVFIVEDDVLIAYYYRDICLRHDAEVVGIAHGADGTADRIVETAPDFVLMDVRLGGRRDGVDIGIEVNDRMPDIKLVYITGSNEPPQIERIRADHPYKLLIKPVLPSDILEAIE